MFYMLADVCLVIHTMPADCVDSVSTFRPTGKGGYRLLSPLVYDTFGALEGAQRKRGGRHPPYYARKVAITSLISSRYFTRAFARHPFVLEIRCFSESGIFSSVPI